MAHLSLFVGNVWSVVHLESSSRVGVIANRFSRMANFSLESKAEEGGKIDNRWAPPHTCQKMALQKIAAYRELRIRLHAQPRRDFTGQ